MNMINRKFVWFLMMGVFSRVCYHDSWSSSCVHFHVNPSNRPKFISQLCSVLYVVGVIRTLEGWSGSQDTELTILYKQSQ